LAQAPAVDIFLDVNLRPPWWRQNEVFGWLEKARWVKLNRDELKVLGYGSADLRQEMAALQSRFCLEQLIVTCGAEGALVLTSAGEFQHAVAGKAQVLIDTVGAGDAFTAVYLHGLLAGWSITDTLAAAQQFAGRIIGLRGATATDTAIYQGIIAG
jgi:fructokinase